MKRETCLLFEFVADDAESSRVVQVPLLVVEEEYILETFELQLFFDVAHVDLLEQGIYLKAAKHAVPVEQVQRVQGELLRGRARRDRQMLIVVEAVVFERLEYFGDVVEAANLEVASVQDDVGVALGDLVDRTGNVEVDVVRPQRVVQVEDDHLGLLVQAPPDLD